MVRAYAPPGNEAPSAAGYRGRRRTPTRMPGGVASHVLDQREQVGDADVLSRLKE